MAGQSTAEQPPRKRCPKRRGLARVVSEEHLRSGGYRGRRSHLKGDVIRVLVTAATRHGSTQEIAQAIAAGLERRGVGCDCRAVGEVHGLDGYDAVVLGSGVYMGHWLDEAHR